MTRAATEQGRAKRDLSARAESFIAIWLAPIALASLVSILAADFVWAAPAAWTTALAWMGAACLLNARRCGRLHCYFSGPILLIGAVAVVALTLGALDLGAYGLTTTVAVALALAAFTYGLERVWGKYRR